MGVILYNCEIAWKAVSCGNKKDEKNVIKNLSDVGKEISKSNRECQLTFTSCIRYITLRKRLTL